MKTKTPASFEELIGNYYGSGDLLDKSNDTRVEELFTQGYGKPLAPKGKKPQATALSLRCDDGETLPQRRKRHRGEEYVVSQSADEVTASEEYIVLKGEPPRENFAEVRPNTAQPQPLDAKRETQVDVRQPLQSAPSPAPRTEENSPTSAQYAAPAPQSRPTPEARPADKPSLFQKEESQAQSTEDDFLADMQSILTGEKVFDPTSKTMVNKDQKGRTQPPPKQQEPAPLPPLPADNGQAIFDRIAQSMQYANAYDLGTVEMETRFADFDKKMDRKTEAKKPTAPIPVVVQSQSGGAVDTSDFLQDLDSIRRQHDVMSTAASRPPMAVPPTYSRPFYDTGEHVLMGGDLYPNRLRVGRDPGVLFSYGQIIAMADLYDSFDQMMNTEFAELDWIKTLIESSTRYYQTNRANPADDISHDNWEKATNGRYMRLALDNFEHFSPNLTLLGRPSMTSPHKDRNHKAAWENYHLSVLEEAAQMYNHHAGNDFFPERPLIINAFGDHFLTDAFAAGHQINKAEMIQLFQVGFYTAKSGFTELNDEGKEFFDKVAARAWHGRVKAEFSKLETGDFRFWGPIPVGHPNINDADRFGTVLQGIAEKAPDHAINIVVKALHDRLNKDGIEVSNTAGDGTWRLTGDGTLNAKNTAIARKAVQQSHDNVIEVAQGQHAGSPVNNSSPGRTIPVVNFDELAARVWRHVPQLTPASRTLLQKLMREYTDPKSSTLIAAAAQLIEDQLDLLIELILQNGALRKA